MSYLTDKTNKLTNKLVLPAIVWLLALGPCSAERSTRDDWKYLIDCGAQAQIRHDMPLAAKLYEQALKKIQSESPGSQKEVQTLARLAFLKLSEMKLDEADRQTDRAIAMSRPYLKKGLEASTFVSFHVLAELYDRVGTDNGLVTVRCFSKALQIKETIHDKDDSSPLKTVRLLSEYYISRRQFKEAIPLYERFIKGRSIKLGMSHPDIAHAQVELAYALEKTGQIKRANEIRDQALKSIKARYGEVAALASVASTYNRARESNKAEPVFLKALELADRDKHGQSQDQDTLSIVLSLAEIYRLRNEYSRAERYYRRYLNSMGRINLNTNLADYKCATNGMIACLNGTGRSRETKPYVTLLRKLQLKQLSGDLEWMPRINAN